MKIKHCFLALSLTFTLLQSASAACMGDLLPFYLRRPSGTTGPGTALVACQLALVKIIAVHPDALQQMAYNETGTLEVSKIGSTGKLPATFSIHFQRRKQPMIDCEAWDNTVLKSGERLLVFVRPQNKGWIVPQLPAAGVVTNVERLPPATLKAAQKMFRG